MNGAVFGILIALAVFTGFLAGNLYVSLQDVNYYQTSAIMTCNYANNLTDIVNSQSKLIDLYTETNLTSLEKLNCSLLE